MPAALMPNAASLAQAYLHKIYPGAGPPLAGAHDSTGIDVDTGWHEHDMHQLVYAFDGLIEIESERHRFLLPSQLAAFIPAGTIHRTHLHKVRSGSVFFAADMIADPGKPIRILRVSPLMREMVIGAMRWPIDQPTDEIGRSYFQTLALLLRDWLKAETPLMLPTSDDPHMRRAMDFTKAHLRNGSCAAVARAAGLSERSLRRRFLAHTGMSWKAYRQRCRLLRATAALGESKHPIGVIAAEVGFESASAFSKVFRKLFGETPKAYRARVKI